MSTISATTVKELREMTGAGMMDCKRALTECEGDMEAAKDWLRKRGQAIADKRASRKASDGLIFSKVADDGSAAALLELNCETDFVARLEAFVKLGDALVDQVLAGGAGATNGLAEELLAAPDATTPGRTVGEGLKERIGTIGENMEIGQFARMSAPAGSSAFQIYIHPPGKLGVLVEFRVGKPESRDAEAFNTLAQDVAMHIAAASPLFLNRDSVAADKLEREKAIYKEQALNEGKPEKIAEKIIEGRVAKFYKEVCLIEQQFVKDPDLTIDALVKKAGKEIGDEIAIAGFRRIKVGG